MRREHRFAAVLVASFAAASTPACSAHSPRRDPLTCERDPACAKHERTFDCSEQCSDDPACVERCEQVQQQTGSSSVR